MLLTKTCHPIHVMRSRDSIKRKERSPHPNNIFHKYIETAFHNIIQIHYNVTIHGTDNILQNIPHIQIECYHVKLCLASHFLKGKNNTFRCSNHISCFLR